MADWQRLNPNQIEKILIEIFRVPYLSKSASKNFDDSLLRDKWKNLGSIFGINLGNLIDTINPTPYINPKANFENLDRNSHICKLFIENAFITEFAYFYFDAQIPSSIYKQQTDNHILIHRNRGIESKYIFIRYGTVFNFQENRKILNDLDNDAIQLKEDFENLKDEVKSYRELHKLDATIKYWNDIAKKSKSWFYGYSAALVILFGLFLTYYFCYVHSKLINISESQKYLSAIAPYFLPTLMFIWIARILTKFIYRSNQMAEDAALRKNMIDTYIRLIKEGKLEGDEKDKAIMMQSIFRPLPNHEYKDDNSITLLENIIGKKTGQ